MQRYQICPEIQIKTKSKKRLHRKRLPFRFIQLPVIKSVKIRTVRKFCIQPNPFMRFYKFFERCFRQEDKLFTFTFLRILSK